MIVFICYGNEANNRYEVGAQIEKECLAID